MLERILQYLEEKPVCPHCNRPLSLCHAPPIHVGDGLGWGSEYLFICLNDDCPLYKNGWQFIEQQYGHVGSYRYMQLPGSKESYSMMVGGQGAFTDSVVDVEALRRQNERHRALQQALAELDDCVAQKNLAPVLTVILDEAARQEDRKRAVDLLAPLNDLACLEPLRNHAYKNDYVHNEVNLALRELLQKNFLKECPFCAELVKARAQVCMHCKRDLPA